MTKNNFYKPKYKSLINIKENFLNKNKIFKFTRQKWLNSVLLKRLKKKTKSKHFFRLFDHSLYYRSKSNNFYKKRYKHNLMFKKKLCKLLGNFKIKRLKLVKFTTKTFLKKKSYLFSNKAESYYLEFFESNLDNIIRRTCLSVSVRESRDIINKGYVFVNGKRVIKHLYKVKKGDLISFDSFVHGKLLQNFYNLTMDSIVYPFPDYMEVNYKILQIKIFSDKINKKYLNQYPFKLETKKLERYLV